MKLDTTPDPKEHFCSVHPLGLIGDQQIERYWCGHTCAETVCRRWFAVWAVTHPLQIIRHLRGLDYAGRSR